MRLAKSQDSRPDAVRSYLKACLKLAGKAEGSLATLKGAECPEAALEEIARLIAHVRRFADQIKRRVLQKETIPHGEKVFSIFEEHTRWISKGKAGTPFELGVPVSIVEDGIGFVLGHEIMWTGGDTDVAVPLVKRCQKSFPDLRGCSFDRGYHSPSNRERLDELLDLNGLPKKGKLSAAERERESEPAFAAARRKHSGVESAINGLEHRGLDKVRLRGPDGFKRAVGLSVLAFNLHRIGRILLERERKRRRKRTRRDRKPQHQFQPLRAACAKTPENRCGRGNVDPWSRTGLVPPQNCAPEDTRQADRPKKSTPFLLDTNLQMVTRRTTQPSCHELEYAAPHRDAGISAVSKGYCPADDVPEPICVISDAVSSLIARISVRTVSIFLSLS